MLKLVHFALLDQPRAAVEELNVGDGLTPASSCTAILQGVPGPRRQRTQVLRDFGPDNRR